MQFDIICIQNHLLFLCKNRTISNKTVSDISLYFFILGMKYFHMYINETYAYFLCSKLLRRTPVIKLALQLKNVNEINKNKFTTQYLSTMYVVGVETKGIIITLRNINFVRISNVIYLDACIFSNYLLFIPLKFCPFGNRNKTSSVLIAFTHQLI